MVERLSRVPDVVKVECEGPQSSVLIPLRMAHGIAGTACRMSTVLGTGPVTQAIVDSMQRWGIDLEITHQLDDADSPIEFSFRDPTGPNASLILYPVTRQRYRGAIGQLLELPDHLILNRYNNGLRDIAKEVSAHGGIVSFRPRELGRFDRIDDYISLLKFTTQLVISSRHGVLRAFAQRAGIDPGRRWPENLQTLEHTSLGRMATWMIERMHPRAVVVLHRYGAADSVFYCSDHPQVIVDAPEGYGTESRAARIQGALLGRALLGDSGISHPVEAGGWRRCCEDVVDLAFRGTDVRPWWYPGLTEKKTAIRTDK